MTARVEISVPGRPVFSHAADAVRAGGYLFVAGILPADASGALVGAGDLDAQARRVLADLVRILAAGGCAPADVVKVTVYLTALAGRPAVDRALARAFAGARPAATIVEVSGLAVEGAKIEVDAIARVPREHP